MFSLDFTTEARTDQFNPAAFYMGGPGDVAPWPRTFIGNPGANNFDPSIFKNFASRRPNGGICNCAGKPSTPSIRGATGTRVLSVPSFSSPIVTNNLRRAGSGA